MTNLNQLAQIKRKKIRVGRGIGSGKGKTSGRGVKGQKSRSGVAIKSFEGGQMPLYRRLPKRGFNPINRENIAKLNLNKIQILIENKTIPSGTLINIDFLKKNKIVSNKYSKVKLLGSGEIKSKIDFEVDYASKSVIKKLEKIGSKLTLKKK
tara:strand:+ start:1862 stop:2317 length:456 start_codon:yes stop_codon:yes gene_type:complete